MDVFWVIPPDQRTELMVRLYGRGAAGIARDRAGRPAGRQWQAYWTRVAEYIERRIGRRRDHGRAGEPAPAGGIVLPLSARTAG